MRLKMVLYKRHRLELDGKIYESDDYYTGNISNAWKPVISKHRLDGAMFFDYGISLIEVCQRLGMEYDSRLHLELVGIKD